MTTAPIGIVVVVAILAVVALLSVGYMAFGAVIHTFNDNPHGALFCALACGFSGCLCWFLLAAIGVL